ncbi:MAG: phosphatase PAP2 family protein [Oscillospiraceae bacterium]|nr:phosphatase PAP2 family protein [Oscillospiraceae bacterium]
MKTKMIILALLKSLILFTIVTILVLTENAATANINHAFYTLIADKIHPTLTTTAVWISNLTHWYSYTPIILMLLILSHTRVKVGVPVGVALVSSAILGPIILKNIFAIDRPTINQIVNAGGFGYPSGHAMNATVFFGMCAVMVVRYARSKVMKVLFFTFAIICMLLVGLSRIYLGVHTLTDVVGGYFAGSAVVCAAVLIERHIYNKAARASERS